MTALAERLQSRRKALLKQETENEILQKQIGENEDEIVTLAEQLDIGQTALQFLEDLANNRRGSLKAQIEKVVSEALHIIYGPDYGMELVYDVKNNRSSMTIEFVRDTKAGQVRRDIEGHGGGVSDSISVPLRLLVLLGSKQTDKVVLLDECYKHMDPERIEGVARFIKDVSDQLELQIVMCSHWVDVMREQADKTWRLWDEEGVTKMEVLP